MMHLPVTRNWVNTTCGKWRTSLCVNWRFTNFNVAFREVVGDPSRSFLVYSDVVDSNVIGGEMHPLVCEVEYRRQGKGMA